MAEPLKLLVLAGRKLGQLCLSALPSQEELAVAVITQDPDGVDGSDWNPPLLPLAHARGYRTFPHNDIRHPETMQAVQALAPDLLISCFYNQRIPVAILKVPRYGAVNLHFGQLPAYRGRFIVSHLLLNGERTAIVTAHYMTKELDAGDILCEEPVTIDPRWTARDLYFRCADVGASVFRRIVDGLLAGAPLPAAKPQTGPVGYYRFEEPNHCEVDLRWSRQQIERFIRALTFPPISTPYLVINGEKYLIRHVPAGSSEVLGPSPAPRTKGWGRTRSSSRLRSG